MLVNLTVNGFATIFAPMNSVPQVSAKQIIIIAAPSGAGKTSITHFLLDKYADKLAFSISATTRKARSTEEHGKDYYFIDVAEFQQKIQENAFVEWEMVYEGKYYGTLKSELERIWALGKTPILDIDVKGAIHIQSQFTPEQTKSIFIMPPSIAELKRRLESRGNESAESIAIRVNKASYEISFKDSFDEIILNDNLQKACWEAEQVISNFLGWNKSTIL
ncbi:MAG: guanylate kinase [Chitinophagaceae bacterium]